MKYAAECLLSIRATPPSLEVVYRRLLDAYGPQHWWPAEGRFEVMVGAILTQSAAWSNVEKAIGRLKAASKLSPSAIRETPVEELAELVYSSGYYNAKARKLKALAAYVGERFGDDIDAMRSHDTQTLRTELLDVHGVGDETADDILLYALDKPVFVIDAYTRRLLSRLGVADEKASYAHHQKLFMDELTHDAELFSEYHALIVTHAKGPCRKRPECSGCTLLDLCPTGQTQTEAAP